jgi:hypothetical protein
MSEEKEKTEESEEKEEKKEGGSPVTMDDVKEVVNSALEPFKKLLGSDDSSGATDGDDKKTEPGDGNDEKKVRRSYATIQQEAQKMVREQIDAVLGEREHKKEHEDIKKQKVTEKSPIKVRRSTKFWLGKDYGND